MFEIKTDRVRRIICLRMSGSFTVNGARDCAAAKEAAVEALGPPYEDHSTLVDIRDFRIQPQEIFAIFTSFVEKTERKSRRIAIVGGEGTARMQFRRITEREPLREDMRYFVSVDEADTWLNETPAASA